MSLSTVSALSPLDGRYAPQLEDFARALRFDQGDKGTEAPTANGRFSRGDHAESMA